MATLQATTASNGPRINPDSIDAIEAIINEYDFYGNFDSLTIEAVDPDNEDADPHLRCFGHATFSPSKPVLDEDGSIADREYVSAEDVLERLAPHLEEPLVVQTVGFEKCRFPLLASQWVAWPDGTLTHNTFDTAPEKPVTSKSDGDTIVNWPTIRETLSLVLEERCPNSKDVVLETMGDALGNHAEDLICEPSTGAETDTVLNPTHSTSDSSA